jgi:hypothetical protein
VIAVAFLLGLFIGAVGGMTAQFLIDLPRIARGDERDVREPPPRA